MTDKATLAIGHLKRKFGLRTDFIAKAIGQTETNISKRKTNGECLRPDEAAMFIKYLDGYSKELTTYLENAMKNSLGLK